MSTKLSVNEKRYRIVKTSHGVWTFQNSTLPDHILVKPCRNAFWLPASIRYFSEKWILLENERKKETQLINQPHAMWIPSKHCRCCVQTNIPILIIISTKNFSFKDRLHHYCPCLQSVKPLHLVTAFLSPLNGLGKLQCLSLFVVWVDLFALLVWCFDGYYALCVSVYYRMRIAVSCYEIAG